MVGCLMLLKIDRSVSDLIELDQRLFLLMKTTETRHSAFAWITEIDTLICHVFMLQSNATTMYLEMKIY